MLRDELSWDGEVFRGVVLPDWRPILVEGHVKYPAQAVLDGAVRPWGGPIGVGRERTGREVIVALCAGGAVPRHRALDHAEAGEPGQQRRLGAGGFRPAEQGQVMADAGVAHLDPAVVGVRRLGHCKPGHDRRMGEMRLDHLAQRRAVAPQRQQVVAAPIEDRERYPSCSNATPLECLPFKPTFSIFWIRVKQIYILQLQNC